MCLVKVCMQNGLPGSLQKVYLRHLANLNVPVRPASLKVQAFTSHMFQGESEVDVIAEQLKFRACLKILMTELRTLATGFEVDGGKLRFQLYSWLEKEIAAMHKICNYKVNFDHV